MKFKFYIPEYNETIEQAFYFIAGCRDAALDEFLNYLWTETHGSEWMMDSMIKIHCIDENDKETIHRFTTEFEPNFSTYEVEVEVEKKDE
jgi:hypothetical protein